MNDNINYGVNYGNIGGSGNTVYNFPQLEQPIFENVGEVDSEISFGVRNILKLKLLIEYNEYIEEIIQEIQRGVKDKRYPIRIRITNLVDGCAQGVYNSNGNNDDEVWKLVHSLFSLACNIAGRDFYMRHRRVGSQWYYELYPAWI